MKNYNGRYVACVETPNAYKGWKPCIDWCGEQFGNSVMDEWRYVGEGVFAFRKEQDYVLFLLRWS